MSKESDLNNEYQKRKELLESISKLEEESSKNFESFFRLTKNYNKILSNSKALQGQINDFQQQIKSGMNDGNKLSKAEIGLLKKKVSEYQKTVELSKANLKNINLTNIALKSAVNTAADFANNLDVYDFIMESDGAIRTLNRDLGITGDLANTVRQNIQDASIVSARYGVTIEHLAEMQRSFADTTGKLAPLTQVSLERFSVISKALGLSAEATGEMAGNFNTIGISSAKMYEFVESTVKSSEGMGISGVKTVKILNENFNKLNNFKFQGGIKAFKELVQYSQKTRMNIEGVFNATEQFNNLEGAIENTAKLINLGGEMSRIDPLNLAMNARNNPEKFAEQLVNMTKGIASFNKASGQFDISAVDMDRLKVVAEVTNQKLEDLVKTAKKLEETRIISSKTFGLSKSDKETISQLASFDENTKKFVVQIDGKSVDVGKVSPEQIKYLRDQGTNLENIAKNSQTFDETFKNTIMQLKSSLLPVLNAINTALGWLNKTGDDFKGITLRLVSLGVALGGLKYVSDNLGNITKNLLSAPFKALAGGGSAGIGKVAGGAVEGASKGAGSLASNLDKVPSGSALSSRAKGMMAFGASLVLISSSIWIASKAVSSLAESFSKLSDKQVNGVLKGLAGITGAMISLSVVGAVLGNSMLVPSLAILGIGSAVGIASAGIGYMIKQFASLTDPNLGKNTLALASGIGVLAASSALLANPLSIAGLVTFGAVMGGLSSVNFSGMQGAFTAANTFLQSDSGNLVELRKTIDMLNSVDTSMFAELKKIMNQPLQMEFKDKTVALNIDITNTIDGEAIGKKINIGKRAIIEVVNMRRGV